MGRRNNGDELDQYVVYAGSGHAPRVRLLAGLRSRSRVILVAGALATMLAVGVGSWLHHRYVNNPHGQPDPGGRRMTFLHQVSEKSLPADATVVHKTTSGFRWDHGGCDGGAAGWTNAEIDLTFTGTSLAASERSILRAGWTAYRDAPQPQGEPQPVQLPADQHQYRRQGHDPFDSVALLYPDGKTWELDISAPPAEIPTHSC